MLRPITDVLRRLKSGTLIDDASTKMAELVKKVEETGKPGELTMKIRVSMAPAGAMALAGEVTTKLPKESRVETLMFPTPEGNLEVEDPRQPKLPFIQPVEPSGEVRMPASAEK